MGKFKISVFNSVLSLFLIGVLSVNLTPLVKVFAVPAGGEPPTPVNVTNFPTSANPMPGVATAVYGTLTAHRTNVIANDTINTTNLNAIAVNMSAYSGAYVNVLINGTATFTPYWWDSVLSVYSASYYPTNITGTGTTASSFYVPTKNSEKFAIGITAGSSGFNTSATVQGVNGL
jgi:hypothetical protein